MNLEGKHSKAHNEEMQPAFKYVDEQFADIQMLRYKVEGFEKLTLKQKSYIYYLQEAALQGRDILFDQNGRYNLRIRRVLEAIYVYFLGDKNGSFYQALSVYLKRVWFSSGIHHHYGCEKFVPEFSESDFREAVKRLPVETLKLPHGQSVEDFLNEICPVIFNPEIMPMRVNQKAGDDLVKTSACNYYGAGISQSDAEAFYAKQKNPSDTRPVMVGMNSRLIRNAQGNLEERVWKIKGLYGTAIEKIVSCLLKARCYADTEAQHHIIDLLIDFYKTGNLHTFDDYSIAWLQDTSSLIDFTNGFTESYGDPLGMKASWEAFVNFKDVAATERTEKLSAHAQWFEDHSPVDARFKKEKVRGVSAKVITAAILAGDLYPSTAIGINLPNSDWVRREYGSKSVTIGNITDAYNKATHGSGMEREFVIDDETRALISQYGDVCDNLHTDLHECLGHGSGKLLPSTDPDSLRAYGSTIEEARADLFGLYYIADPKLVELNLTPNMEAYKSQYYTYMMNGLITQLVRIKPGHVIEEAHMRNRALIARWAFEKGQKRRVVEFVEKQEKTYVKINDYVALRQLFGQLLAEIQRIKSEGDFEAARDLVERYGVKIDARLHQEVLQRYEQLHLSPYKGFINPVYIALFNKNGTLEDVSVSYAETYEQQMLRYSHDYNTLPDIND